MIAAYQKRARLSRAEIGEVIKNGARAQGALCSYVWRRGGASRAVSVVVSKKVCATAVGRNQLKRRMRAAFWATPFTSSTTARCVVIAKVAARTATYAALREEFAQKLSRTV